MSEPFVGVWFFVAYRDVEHRILQALWDDGFDVTPAQGRIAARLSPGGNRVSEIAEMAQVTKQTASLLVEGLERGGYVERVPDPADARARIVRFTERGTAAVRRARREERRIEREWTAHLGADDMRDLRRIMGSLREVTDPYADRP